MPGEATKKQPHDPDSTHQPEKGGQPGPKHDPQHDRREQGERKENPTKRDDQKRDQGQQDKGQQHDKR